MLGGTQQQPSIITETIPTQVPEHRIPLIVHRMPAMPSAVVSRNKRYMFADETLLSADTPIKEEFEWCVNAGAVAVVQDDMGEESVQAARDSGLDLILLPNMSPLRMVWYDATIDDPASVARYWVKMIQETEQWSDTLYQQDGRPVMWLFAATRAPSDYYTTVRRLVREMGYDPVVFYHAQLRSGNSTPAEVEGYMRVFDGAFVWGDGYDTIRQMVELVVSARNRIESETGVRKQIILTSKPGHWRSERGLLIDAHGTREFRETVELAYQYQLDGLNIESWNDYGEMHHIQPSVLKSTVLSDLCTYYGNLGIGNPAEVEYPGVYVSHRRDIAAGEYLECEVLHLPVAEPGNRTVRLILRSPDGHELFSSAWTITAAEAGAKTFNIPTRGMNVPLTVIPALEINGVEQATGTFCEVNPVRMAYPFTMNMSMAKALHPSSVQFAIDGHAAGSTYVSTNDHRASISLQSGKKISRIEIMRNYMPVYCAAFDQFMQTKSPSDTYQVAGFYWNIPAAVEALKDAPQNGMDFGGEISLQGGAALHAVQMDTSRSVLDSPSRVVWGMDASRRRPHDAVEIAFEGNENTVFDINMPNQSFRFQVRWGDILQNGWKEYPLLSHSRLVVKPMPGVMGHPVPLETNEYAATADLPPDEILPNRILNDRNRNTYYLRAIAEDQSIYRSAPIHVLSGSPEQHSRIYSWDVNRAERFELQVPEVLVKDVVWDIQEGSPRIITDRYRTGYALELGGMHERDGRFDPSQIPEIVRDGEEAALSFDGNDVAIVRAQLIPLGSWMVDMQIRPENIGLNRDQVLFDVPEAVSIILQSNGTLRVWYGDSALANVRLTGGTVLENGKWYRLNFMYDLNEARLLLDGKIEGTAPVKGFRRRITQKANIGAAFPAGVHVAPAERGFFGKIKDISITLHADKMDALKSAESNEQKGQVSRIYYDDFSGSETGLLTGKAPDTAPGRVVWLGADDSMTGQWKQDGTITETNNARRNMFLPFTPEPGKIYTLKIDVSRIGALNQLQFGFVQNANPAGGFPLANDNVGASPWMNFAAINGNVNTFLGPLTEGEGGQVSGQNPEEMNTLQIVLNTAASPWGADWFVNGKKIRSARFGENPSIRYVGFGRYNQGTFRVDHFELTEFTPTGALSVQLIGKP